MGEFMAHKIVKTSELKPSMIIVGASYKGKDMNKRLLNMISQDVLKANGQIDSNDIKRIIKTGKKWQFKIKETMPFAPFLFGGVLLTIIFKGNLSIIFNIEILKTEISYIISMIISSILLASILLGINKIINKKIINKKKVNKK